MADAVLRGGVDLGGTKIQAVIADPDHNVLGQARRPTPTEGGPSDVVDAIAEALAEAAEQAGVELSALSGIGVGAPGAIDESKGTLARAGNLPDWQDPYPLAEKLAKKTGAKVVRLGNDVQVATDAEFTLGAAREFDSLLGVFWGTGVGGGIVLDGKPWLGRGAAGEIGHIPVRHHGLKCPCGRHGCMEAYAGRRAMETRARKAVDDDGEKTILFEIMEEKGRDRLTSGIWWRAIERGDELAERLIDEAVEAIGTAVASACNVLDPEAVIIGGGLGVRFGEPYARRIEDAMMPHLFHDAHPPQIRVAELGDLGGALGAALLVA
ncbi:ROK family protein [Baekduia sp. Peel2402]|uniref:ROK family protein n=1 Tax=Baekduia sp. Peel2402 TaxID=3458296 RepID=UPI00403EBFF7